VASLVSIKSPTRHSQTATTQLQSRIVPVPQLGVVSAPTNSLLQTFETDNSTAHVVAVDNANGNIYVPIHAQGIVVYALAYNGTNGTVSASGSATSTKTVAPALLTASAGKLVASFTVGLELTMGLSL
jgi:hypothetical protein